MFEIWVRLPYDGTAHCFTVKSGGIAAAQMYWDMLEKAGFEMMSARP